MNYRGGSGDLSPRLLLTHFPVEAKG